MKNSIMEIIKKTLKAFDLRKLFSIRCVIKRKNLQIREEREKYLAEKEVNRILSSYIFYLASEYGVVRVPKSEISLALNKHEVTFCSDGDDYVIMLKDLCVAGEEEVCGEAGKL